MHVVGLKIKSNLLSVDDIKQLDKTLVLPESATKGDRKRAIKNWLRPFLGKHIKTSDGKVVVVNSADSMWHLSYNGNRNDLKAKVVPYVFDVLTFGEFIEREDLSHERKDDFIAFHVYRKWCEVEGKQVYSEAHAGERENGVIELVVYNQKLAIKKNEGSLGTLKPLNNDQVPKYALDDHNKPVFDDAQVSDDLAVEDGDLVKILEVKELAVNLPSDENELLIAKLEKEMKESFAENARKDAYRSKTSYKAHRASTSAFPVSRDYFEKKEKNGWNLLWDRSEPISKVTGQQPSAYAAKPDNKSSQVSPIANGQSNDILADNQKVSKLKNNFDSATSTSVEAILAAMRQALDVPSEENIQALASEAGLRIKPYASKEVTQEQALANLDWLDKAEPVATMKGDEVPRFDKVKLLTEWVGQYWEEQTGGKVNRADLGEIVVDKVAAKNSAYHGMNKAKAKAFYLVPNALKNGVLLGKLPTENGKISAFIVAAPVSIDDKVYRLLMEVRSDENMQRLYVHEVVLREEISPLAEFKIGADSEEAQPSAPARSDNKTPLDEFKTAAASQKEAEPHSPPRGAIYNFMLNLRKIQAEKLRESPLSTSMLSGAPSVQNKATDASDGLNIAQPENTASQTKTITVKVPVSSNTLANYTAGAWRDLSLLTEADFLKTWQYVNAANYMLRNSIEVSDAKNGNRHVLGQSGKPELVKLVNDEFIKRGLDEKYSLFVERKNNRLDSTDLDPQAILAAMRQALDVPSEENIQALASEAGLRIKPIIKYQDGDKLAVSDILPFF